MTAKPATKRNNDDAAMRIARALIAGKARFVKEQPQGIFTLGAAADIIRAQLAIEYPKPAKTPRVNGRDELFDAIALACEIDLTCLTRNMSGLIATAKRDILEASPDVTPDEVERRAELYRKKYRTGQPDGCACTPTALANHWSEFGRPTEKKTRGFDYTQEPPDWAERLRKTGMPGWSRDLVDNLCQREWAEVRTNYGREIWTALGGATK